jgi:hypothetical protein
MRLLALTGLMMASTALFACQASNPPQAASVPAPAIVQDAQPTPVVAEFPPANIDVSASAGANGPPLNILKPPR